MYSHVLGAKAEVDEAPTSAAAAASMVLRLNIMVLVVGMYFLLQRRLIMAAITARFMEWAKILASVIWRDVSGKDVTFMVGLCGAYVSDDFGTVRYPCTNINGTPLPPSPSLIITTLSHNSINKSTISVLEFVQPIVVDDACLGPSI